MTGEAQPATDQTETYDAEIPSFDFSDLPQFYPDGTEAARKIEIAINDDRKLIRTPTRRVFNGNLKAKNAAEYLRVLPADGETHHCLMRGNFDGWDLIPTVLELAAPAKVKRLDVATLGFNRRGTDALIGYLDDGSISELLFVASCYFRSADSEIFEYAHVALTSRGHRMVAARSHAKLILFEMTDGRHFAIESSANMRSCRNIEQFCFTHDRDLLHFHRSWLEQVASEDHK